MTRDDARGFPNPIFRGAQAPRNRPDLDPGRVLRGLGFGCGRQREGVGHARNEGDLLLAQLIDGLDGNQLGVRHKENVGPGRQGVLEGRPRLAVPHGVIQVAIIHVHPDGDPIWAGHRPQGQMFAVAMSIFVVSPHRLGCLRRRESRGGGLGWGLAPMNRCLRGLGGGRRRICAVQRQTGRIGMHRIGARQIIGRDGAFTQIGKHLGGVGGMQVEERAPQGIIVKIACLHPGAK